MNSCSKAQLRKTLRQQLKRISNTERQQAAVSAMQAFTRHLAQPTNCNIGAYWPLSTEFDCRPLLYQCQRQAAKLYLPAVIGAEQMIFRLLEATEPTACDQLNMPCPPATSPTIDSQQLDIALLPLAGFDLKGGRLGAGGGYYDRFFGAKLSNSNAPPCLVGLAFAAQQCEQVPTKAHDVHLDAILTEAGFLPFSSYTHNCGLFNSL